MREFKCTAIIAILNNQTVWFVKEIIDDSLTEPDADLYHDILGEELSTSK